MNVLVAYASKYGSTHEVAESVATEMRHVGIDVEVLACSGVTSLAGYDCVIVGSPLYIGSMLKDARRFLDRLQAEISSVPSAMFLLGPVRATDDMDEARKQIDGVLHKAPWFKPIDVEMFVGAYDPQRLGRLDKLAAIPPASPLHGVGAFDDRDWSAIREWAAGTARRFLAEGQEN